MTAVVVFCAFALWFGLALIPAKIANDKGHSYGGFFVFGLFFFLPALVTSLLIQPAGRRQPTTSSSPRTEPMGYSLGNPGVSSRGGSPGGVAMRSCPHCFSQMPAAASVCATCRRDVTPASTSAPGGSLSDGRPQTSNYGAGSTVQFREGTNVCTTPGCDAAGLRTRAATCPVCGKTLQTLRVGGTPGAAAPLRKGLAERGECRNLACGAAGIPTYDQRCAHCGKPTVPVGS